MRRLRVERKALGLRGARWGVMVVMVLALGGCTREPEATVTSKAAVAPTAMPQALDRLVAVNPTPAFRNLGKRAEAKL